MLVNNSNIFLLVIEIRVVLIEITISQTSNAFEILIEIKDLKGNNE